LEEKLKEKHVDTSLIGVCQTCHIPIYHGEPVYTPHDYQTKGEHSGEYGEASHGPGFSNPGTTYTGGGYQGRDKRHSVSEGWIQCGWCYKQYQKELEAIKKWKMKQAGWISLFVIPSILGALGYCWVQRAKDAATRTYGGVWNMMIIWGIASLIIGGLIGIVVARVVLGALPETNRYKLRENPNRKR
jgi:hypothetical protein